MSYNNTHACIFNNIKHFLCVRERSSKLNSYSSRARALWISYHIKTISLLSELGRFASQGVNTFYICSSKLLYSLYIVLDRTSKEPPSILLKYERIKASWSKYEAIVFSYVFLLFLVTIVVPFMNWANACLLQCIYLLFYIL
jgi:hypothetical protein